MTAFRIVLSEEADSQFKKLDNATAGRIIQRLEQAAENPLHFFERLAGREEYKLRVGDYRVLVNLFHNEKTIFVRSLGHRRSIYKK